MRAPSRPLILASLLVATLPGVPAHAGWMPGGITIRATTTPIPLVAACNDDGFGTFVAWHEGTFRVQHLLPTGDPDPAWPVDGAVACDIEQNRIDAGLLPDGSGGVYLWWVQDVTSAFSLRILRLGPDGQLGVGWPACGLDLGPISMVSLHPSVIPDGANGVFLAWSFGTFIRAHHLGPDGLGAGGWPNAPRVVVVADPVSSTHFWPDLALAPDGGCFLSWATWSSDTTLVESGLHLRRLTSAGLNAPGWPQQGWTLGAFRPEGLGLAPVAPVIDIAPDGRGGLFLVDGIFEGTKWSGTLANPTLYRLLEDGVTSAPDWPAGGRLAQQNYYYDPSSSMYDWDSGFRVSPDGHDGAVLETRAFYSDSPRITQLVRWTADGQSSWQTEGISRGHEAFVKGDGGVFLATFKCCGPASPFDWPASLRVDQSNAAPTWSSFLETHSEPVLTWFGDVALASTGDGGAVFFWSQSNQQFGLFARRFGPAGEVTGVAGTGLRVSLRGLRFVAGRGVVARASLGGAPGRLELFDVAGRRLSDLRLPSGEGAVDAELPGTASLASGLYFARLVSGGFVAHGKVAIAR